MNAHKLLTTVQYCTFCRTSTVHSHEPQSLCHANDSTCAVEWSSAIICSQYLCARIKHHRVHNLAAPPRHIAHSEVRYFEFLITSYHICINPNNSFIRYPKVNTARLLWHINFLRKILTVQYYCLLRRVARALKNRIDSTRLDDVHKKPNMWLAIRHRWTIICSCSRRQGTFIRCVFFVDALTCSTQYSATFLTFSYCSAAAPVSARTRCKRELPTQLPSPLLFFSFSSYVSSRVD